ncbi:MAG: hypothetical protein ACI9QC_000062 [Oceanicoccus sp.]|jgi:hypothetical protein
MLKNILKLGSKRLLQFAALLLLIWGLNFSIIAVDLWLVFARELGFTLPFLKFLLILAWVFVTGLYVLWRLYQLASLELFKLLFDELAPMRKKFSKAILMQIKKNINDEKVRRGELIDEQLQSFPWIFRFPVKLILQQIPILKLIEIAKQALLEKNKEKACEEFDRELETLIQEIYFELTTFKWLYWVLSVMLLGHGFLMWLLVN